MNFKLKPWMQLLKNKFLLSFLAGLIFFILAFLTLPNYGISWDEPTHFKRGQGYLWFLLTGDNDYNKLSPYDLKKAQNNPDYHERSIYQDDKHNSAFYRTIDGTHPPLADILASLFNMIFYQKLGIMGDVESYHLFEIFIASLGVGILFLFAYEGFGVSAAIFSAIFFATYPLFWAESHFNIKDPVETSWIILTLYFLWKGINVKAVRFILLSSIFAGFALGTKFNIVFLPFIVLPWFLSLSIKQKKELLGFVRSRNFILSIIFYPIISFLIFYISYPFLWENPVVNIGKVLTYYENNALDPAFANAVLPGWPFYAVRWVLLSSPPLVLLGLTLSTIHLKGLLFKHNGLFLLVLLWFSLTIARVSIPGVNIYGGVRQIMEYIPAMSILGGAGLSYLIAKTNNSFKISVILITVAISIYPIVRLHPNQNVYFNFLIGGLSGAVASGVPAAGNSFGNAYYGGLLWLNQNAIPNAKLTLIQGTVQDVPRFKVRSDIDLSNDYFSGINRNGEYLMVLTYNLEHKENFYAWEYLDTFLEPVFEVKADGVSILKVWKNDLEHTKSNLRISETILKDQIYVSNNKNYTQIALPEEIVLSRLKIADECDLSDASFIETSVNNVDWTRAKDPLTYAQAGKKTGKFIPAWQTPDSGNGVRPKSTINFYFAGEKARFIKINFGSEIPCLIKDSNIEIVHLNNK